MKLNLSVFCVVHDAHKAAERKTPTQFAVEPLVISLQRIASVFKHDELR